MFLPDDARKRNFDLTCGAIGVYVAASRANAVNYKIVVDAVNAQPELYVLDWWSDFAFPKREWDFESYVAAVNSVAAARQFQNDLAMIDPAGAVVILLPAGRSAFSELTRAHDLGKPTVAYIGPGAANCEPELMLRFADQFVRDIPELLTVLKQFPALPREKPPICSAIAEQEQWSNVSGLSR
jgi:hypothetical protein